jgi:hypothetical protein
MTYRENKLDLNREFRVMPQEADHYRSDLKPGDIVRGQYGNLARLTGWNHTWSHVRGGRLAHLEPLIAYPGTDIPEGAGPYAHKSSWEDDLSPARPGDVGAHAVRVGRIGMSQHVPANWTR